MFIDKNKPSMNELINWFGINYPELWKSMSECNHAVTESEPNPYHIENSILAHSMMVCQRAEIASETNYNKVSLICALLHDIGKPSAREEIPFEAKKPSYSESNEIRNNGKNNGEHSGLNRIVPKSGLKCHFRSHESISTFLAIPILNKLESEKVINNREKIEILKIVNIHGTLFDSIDKDGKIINPEKVFAKFNEDEVDLFNTFVLQCRNDSLGRFFTSKDGRKNTGYKLGTEIFTEDQFKSHKRKDKSFTNSITVLVGAPNSGKSTWRKENITNEIVISRDDAMIEYAINYIDGSSNMSYSDIWRYLEDNDLHKEIDKIIQTVFQLAVKERKDIVIDMSNMSKKSRRKWLCNVPDCYKKKAVVFLIAKEELYLRNEKREKEENKFISKGIIDNMIKSFFIPMYDEIDECEYIF